MKKKYQKLAQKSIAGVLVATISLTGTSPFILAATQPVSVSQTTQDLTAKEFTELMKQVVFTDATYTALKPTITKASIAYLKGILDTFGYIDTPDEEEAFQLYTTAKSLFPQFAYEKALNQLQNLEIALEKPDFTTDILDRLDEVRDSLLDVEDRDHFASLIVKYDAAYDTLNHKIADYINVTIDGFYTDNTRMAINPNADLTAAYQLPAILDYVRDAAISEPLNQAYNKLIQDIANPGAPKPEIEAAKQVQALFIDATEQTLAAGTTNAVIEKAEKLVQALSASPTKTALLASIAQAKLLIQMTEKEEELKAKVADLFTGKSKSALKNGVTEAMIKALESEVGAMNNGPVKTALQSDILHAYSLLPAENVGPQHPGYAAQVEKAVNALFTTSEQTELKKGVRDLAIVEVETQVKFITQTDVKNRLLQVINKAYNIYFSSISPEYAPLDAAVRALFTDDNETFLKNGVTYEQISAVKARVRVSDIHETSRKRLTARLDHAQSLLNEVTIQKPTIHTYTEHDSYITGTTSQGTAYVGLFIDGKRVKLATVVPGVDYQISAYGFNLTAGSDFEVRSYTKNNTPSEATKATVQAPVEDAFKLTANQLGANDTYVTGEVGSGVDSVRLVVDGVVVKTGQITEQSYKITAAGYVKESSTVQVVGLKGRVEMTRTDVIKASPRAIVSAITTKDDMVTGSVQAGTGTKIRLSINNVAVRTAPITATGEFQTYIGKQKAGTEVKIEVFEGSAYNQARTTIVKVTN